MTKIKPVKFKDAGAKVFCGPMAVAAATGQKADVIAAKLLRYRKKSLIDSYGRTKSVMRKIKTMQVTGTYLWELKFMAGDRYTFWTRPHPQKTTIEGWAAKAPGPDMGPRNKSWYVIETNNHWLAFRDDHIVDTYSDGIPIPIHKHPLLNKRVENIYEVIRR